MFALILLGFHNFCWKQEPEQHWPPYTYHNNYQDALERHDFSAACIECAIFVGEWIDKRSSALIAGFTIGIFFVTAFLAFYTYRLWESTKELAMEAKSSSVVNIEKMTKSITEASRAATAMEKLAVGTDMTAKHQLRAYIGVDSICFDEPPRRDVISNHVQRIIPDGGVLRLVVRNFGESPAHDVTIWREASLKLPSDILKAIEDPGPIEDQVLLFPKHEYSTLVTKQDSTITAETFFWTWGAIRYRDIYGRWWITSYCFTHERNGGNAFMCIGDQNKEHGPFTGRPPPI